VFNFSNLLALALDTVAFLLDKLELLVLIELCLVSMDLILVLFPNFLADGMLIISISPVNGVLFLPNKGIYIQYAIYILYIPFSIFYLVILFMRK
jgi:hypothetical protein